MLKTLFLKSSLNSRCISFSFSLISLLNKGIREELRYVCYAIKGAFANNVFLRCLAEYAEHLGSKGKSRRDGTLLTVGFNLRKLNGVHVLQSPAGTTYITDTKCHPCGTWGAFTSFLVRRLKSTVNKVLSLWDISPLIRHKSLEQIQNFNNSIKYYLS
jgi:hypothetical protein